MKKIKGIPFSDDLINLEIEKEQGKLFVRNFEGVNAGFPSPAEDFVTDRISLDQKYLYRLESTFINKVGGLSMFPDYHLGDLIVVRSDFDPQNGDDIVVSVNNSAYSLKRYDKVNNVLISVNEKYTNAIKLSDSDQVIILGVVTTLIREIKKS